MYRDWVCRVKRHLVDAAVAGGAADALIHVDAVIEVDEFGKIMDAVPGNGLPVRKLSRTGSSMGLLDPDLRMAVHANLGGRHAGELRVFHGGMAIAAIDAQAADMVLMAEGHRLIADDAHAGDVIGTDEIGPGIPEAATE